MKITDLILQALKDIDMPKYYLQRKDETSECIVYNYIETPNQYGDMREISTKYTVLINLYVNSKIETKKELIKNAMQENGFKKITIPSPVNIKGVYNIAMQFKIAVLKNKL